MEDKKIIVENKPLSPNYLSLPANNKKKFYLCDEKIFSLYNNLFPKDTFVLKRGEKNKTLNSLNKIYNFLLNENADRESMLIGVGGGIICDICGFAASTYMRGIDFGFFPTTLLAMVDASIGGKNGININRHKNIVGLFSNPCFIKSNINFLLTLNKKEIRNGFAEIIKHGIIDGENYFNYLDQNHLRALNLDNNIIEFIIKESQNIKMNIVKKDFKEKGIRKKLNLGHTVGHALETVYSLPHGRAVAQGIKIIADISLKLGILDSEINIRIKNLLNKYGLINKEFTFVKEDVLKVLFKDKKRVNNKISLVLIKNIGEIIIQEFKLEEIKSILNDLYQY